MVASRSHVLGSVLLMSMAWGCSDPPRNDGATDGADAGSPAPPDASPVSEDIDSGAPAGADAATPGTPPMFAGVQTIAIEAPGSVAMTWEPAQATSEPVEYDVFLATAAGEQDFAVASYTTDGLSITVEALPVEPGLRHYFVVRARDAAGASDDNTVEASALFEAKPEIELVGQLPLFDINGGITSDIAINDDLTLAAVGGFGSGDSHVVDISDPANPELVTTLEDFGTQNDVEFVGDLLYVSHENRDDRVGITIYDVSDPANIAKVRDIVANGDPIDTGASFCHNITIHDDAPLMYCSSTFDGDVQIFSMGFGDLGGSPKEPVYVGAVGDDDGNVHDVYGRGDRIYVSFLSGGLSIFDVANPAEPTLLGEYEYSGAFTHNAWPSRDGSHVFVTDERFQSSTDGMRVLDATDLGNIEQVAKFERGGNQTVIHNVEVEGDFAYISYYSQGIWIVDVTDPANPVEVDRYETYTGGETGFIGAWGVQATAGPLVFASDFTGGLFILEWDRPDTRITGR